MISCARASPRAARLTIAGSIWMSANLLMSRILDARGPERVAFRIFRSGEVRAILCGFRPGASRLAPAEDAGMAELVDAPDSKSGFRKEVGVRFPLPAPPGLVVSGRTMRISTPLLTEDIMNYCSDCGQPVSRKTPGRYPPSAGYAMPATPFTTRIRWSSLAVYPNATARSCCASAR